ncbi:MAG: hypothetical protein ACLP9L_38185 [Thermoguttaceae bacterium]
MGKNFYKSPDQQSSIATPKADRRGPWLAWIAYGTLTLGMMTLAQGAAAFYFRVNVLTGTRYGPSLMPIYIIFSGIGVCVVGLTLKTIADWKKRKKQRAANTGHSQNVPSADQPAADG